MADTVKSPSINAWDSFDTAGTPVISPTSGEGAGGNVVEQSDYAATTTAGLQSTASTYRLIRLPWTAKLKTLDLTADAALDTSTGLALNVGAYYTDSVNEGLINAANAGLEVNSGVDFASASTAFHSSALGPVSVLGAYSVVKRNEELWVGLGLASNPGGFCDIVVSVEAAATTGGATNLQLRATYVE
jgi:hypothetical protein